MVLGELATCGSPSWPAMCLWVALKCSMPLLTFNISLFTFFLSLLFPYFSTFLSACDLPEISFDSALAFGRAGLSFGRAWRISLACLFGSGPIAHLPSSHLICSSDSRSILSFLRGCTMATLALKLLSMSFSQSNNALSVSLERANDDLPGAEWPWTAFVKCLSCLLVFRSKCGNCCTFFVVVVTTVSLMLLSSYQGFSRSTFATGGNCRSSYDDFWYFGFTIAVGIEFLILSLCSLIWFAYSIWTWSDAVGCQSVASMALTEMASFAFDRAASVICEREKKSVIPKWYGNVRYADDFKLNGMFWILLWEWFFKWAAYLVLVYILNCVCVVHAKWGSATINVALPFLIISLNHVLRQMISEMVLRSQSVIKFDYN